MKTNIDIDWISVDDGLPECKHSTDGGNYSDMCACVNSAGELLILALNMVWDYDEECWTHYWGTYEEPYDEDLYGEIVAWMPLPPFDKFIKP